MSRWHLPMCANPDIQLVDAPKLLGAVAGLGRRVPHCRACGCRPDLERLLAQQKSEATFSAPPPDEPPDELDLWWPTCIRYTHGPPPLPKRRVETVGVGAGARGVGGSALAATSSRLSDAGRSDWDDTDSLDLVMSQSSAEAAYEWSDVLSTSSGGGGHRSRSPSPARWRDEAGPSRTPPQLNLPADNEASSPTPRRRSHDASTVAPPPPSHVYPSRLARDQFRLICLDSPAAADSDRGDDPVHFRLETYRLGACPEYEAASYCWGGEDGDVSRRWAAFVGPHWDVVFQTRNCWNLLRVLTHRRGFRMAWVDAVCIHQEDVVERNEQVARMRDIYSNCSRVFTYLGEKDGGDYAEPEPFAHLLGLNDFLRQNTSRDGAAASNVLQMRYFTRIWIVQELILAPSALFRLGSTEYRRGELSQTIRNPAVPWLRYLCSGGLSDSSDATLLSYLELTAQSSSSDPRDRFFGLLGLPMRHRERLDPNYTLSAAHVAIGIAGFCLTVLNDIRILEIASGIDLNSNLPSWLPNWSSLKNSSFEFPSVLAEEVDYAARAPAADARLFALVHETTPGYIGINSTNGALSISMVRILRFRSPLRRHEPPGSWFRYSVKEDHWTMTLMTRHSSLHRSLKPGRDCLYLIRDINANHDVFLILRQSKGVGKTFRLIASCPAVYFVSQSLEHPWSERRFAQSKRLLTTLARFPEMGQILPRFSPNRAKMCLVWICTRVFTARSADIMSGLLSCIGMYGARVNNGYLELCVKRDARSYISRNPDSNQSKESEISQAQKLAKKDFSDYLGQSNGAFSLEFRASGKKWMGSAFFKATWPLQSSSNQSRAIYVRISVSEITEFFQAFINYLRASIQRARSEADPDLDDAFITPVWDFKSDVNMYARAMWCCIENSFDSLSLDEFERRFDSMAYPVAWPDSLLNDFAVDGSTVEITIE